MTIFEQCYNVLFNSKTLFRCIIFNKTYLSISKSKMVQVILGNAMIIKVYFDESQLDSFQALAPVLLTAKS